MRVRFDKLTAFRGFGCYVMRFVNGKDGYACLYLWRWCFTLEF